MSRQYCRQPGEQVELSSETKKEAVKLILYKDLTEEYRLSATIYIEIRVSTKQSVNEELVLEHLVINRYWNKFGKNKGNVEGTR